jgi:hypothetical protein
MTRTVPETDWEGNFILSSQVWTTARDLARLGLLYLNDGVWNGERILPPAGALRLAPRPRPAGVAATAMARPSGPSPRAAALPADAYVARGNRGQYLAIIPSRQIVIVRRGFDGPGTAFDLDAFTATCSPRCASGTAALPDILSRDERPSQRRGSAHVRNDPQVVYWQDQAQVWLPRILGAIAILVIAYILARAAKWAIAKIVDRVPALKKHYEAEPGKTLGSLIGDIAFWLILLIGIMLALQPLGLSQVLEPVRQLTTNTFAFIPNLIGAGLIFFIGLSSRRSSAASSKARCSPPMPTAGCARPASWKPPEPRPPRRPAGGRRPSRRRRQAPRSAARSAWSSSS